MNRLVEGILVLSLVAGCGGSGTSWRQPENAATIEREAAGWFEGWHRKLAAGDVDGWGAAFAPGGLLFPVDPDAALVGPEAITAEVRRDFGPSFAAGMHLAIDSITLEMGLADDGRSAWIADELEFREDVGGALGAKVPVRNTVLLERQGADWRVVVAHYSRATDEARAAELEERSAFPPPAAIEDAVETSAARIAEIFSASLASAEAFTSMLSKRPGTIAFGPAPRDRYHGTHEVSEWVRSIYARPGVHLVRDGGLRAALAAGGNVGWVATNVDIVTTRGGQELVRPCRMTAIFAREGDGWAIVQLHLSHGVREGD